MISSQIYEKNWGYFDAIFIATTKVPLSLTFCNPVELCIFYACIFTLLTSADGEHADEHHYQHMLGIAPHSYPHKLSSETESLSYKA